MPSLKIDEKQVYFKKTGKGIPVVLIHGFCEDHRIWDSVYENISGEILRIDLPGFGKSDLISKEQLEQYASYIQIATVEVRFDKYILFGHSMGGYIGLEILKTNPDKLLGLGLVHSHPFGDTDETIEKRNKAIEFVINNGSQNFGRTMFPNLFLNPEKHWESIELLIDRCGDVKEQGIINALKSMRDRADRSELLVNTPIPIFYFTGREDPAIPADRLLGIASETQISFVDVIEDAAHMGMYESTDRLIKDMNSFILYCSQ